MDWLIKEAIMARYAQLRADQQAEQSEQSGRAAELQSALKAAR